MHVQKKNILINHVERQMLHGRLKRKKLLNHIGWLMFHAKKIFNPR